MRIAENNAKLELLEDSTIENINQKIIENYNVDLNDFSIEKVDGQNYVSYSYNFAPYEVNSSLGFTVFVKDDKTIEIYDNTNNINLNKLKFEIKSILDNSNITLESNEYLEYNLDTNKVEKIEEIESFIEQGEAIYRTKLAI